MNEDSGNPARRIEVIFSEVDRKVAVDLAEGHTDEAAGAVADDLVVALGIDDADEAEHELSAGAGRHVAIRRLR